jgi:bacteriocin biosynthesis cyclodehydratase domain-containing protein
VLLLLPVISDCGEVVPELPLLKPWYRLLRQEGRVLLEHGRTVVAFEGAAARAFLPALLPLLDGSRNVDEICELIGPKVRVAVENALELLGHNGLLLAGPRLAEDDHGRAVAESLAAAGVSVLGIDEIATRLATTPVQLLGDEAACDALGRLLQRSGICAFRGDPPGSATPGLVVVGPGGDRARTNRLALENGAEWLPVGEFDGRAVSVGPLIVPRESACFEYLLLRRESTSGCAQELALFRDVAVPADPRPSLLAAAVALAAELVVRWIGARDPFLPGTLFTLDAEEGFSVASHTVLRVPRCPACSSSAGLAPPSPWHEAQAA